MDGQNPQGPQPLKSAYIRTMQEDLEKLKKGLPPQPQMMRAEAPQNIPIAPENPEPTYEAPAPEPELPPRPEVMPTFAEPKMPPVAGLAIAPEIPATPEGEMAEVQIPEEKKMGLPLILGIAGIVVVLIVGGIAAYFLLFRKPAAVVEQPAPTEEVPVEVAPTSTQPAAPVVPEPSLPKSIVSTDLSQTVNLNTQNKDELAQTMKNLISAPNQVGKVSNILLKVSAPTQKFYLSIKQIFQTLNIGSADFVNLLADPSQLLGYTQEGSQRLGFIVEVGDTVKMKSVMIAWENKNKIVNDLAPIFLNSDPRTLKSASKKFLTNKYLGIDVRYLNLPSANLTIDYAIIPDKNLLILATSKDSMLRTIDLLVKGY